jgi:hypothetical protein
LKIRHDPIKHALTVVERLSGFYYSGNALAHSLGLNTGGDVGVSAQDVARVFPAALGPKIENEYLSVRYERLVPLLIEAIKELNEKVTALESKK